MAEASEQIPRPFLLLTIAVCATSLGTFILSWHNYPPSLTFELVLVIVGAAVSEFFAFEVPNFTYSLAYPLVMGAMVLGGPAAAGLVAAFSAVTVSDFHRRRPWPYPSFNLGQLVLVSCLGGWTYVLLGGRVMATGGGFKPFGQGDFPAALIGMLAAALLVSVLNLVLVALAIGITSGEGPKRIFSSAAPMVPTQTALAFVGFLMAQVLAVSALALPLFVFPLFVARQLHQRYTSLREAYVDTVRSLVGALEAKDPYTRGHSQRVAVYAKELAEHMGFDHRAVSRLEYAALLHDLGKLRLPQRILVKPGRLTSEEFALVREHPVTGANMVARVPPLRDLSDYVRFHHLYFDGGGYPEGCAVADVPLGARVLAVADSFDAMTSTRAYRAALTREAAVAELIGGAGTQFDPEVVRTFIHSQVGRQVVNDEGAEDHTIDHPAVPALEGEQV